MANYIIQGETLKAIADEVRDLTGISEEINPNEMVTNIGQANADVEAQTDIIGQIKAALDGKALGDTEKLEALIDNSGVLDNADAAITEKIEQLVGKAEIEKLIYNASLLKENCQHEFRHWTGKKLPKTNYIKSAYFNYFVADSGIETIDYYLDWNCQNTAKVNMQSAFENTPNLTTMVGVNTKYATSVSSLFHKSGIVSIQEPFDFSNITNSGYMSAFTTATSLVDLRIVPETWKWGTSVVSAVLSDESIQSIIDGLATVETAQTLTLNKDVKAKLTETQLATITGKNWNLA